MPLDNEKLKKVYSTLKEGGYDQDYNTFVKGFSGNDNYNNRKQVYDLLTQNGAQVGKNYADFMQRLYTPSPKQTQTQAQQPRVNRGSMVRAVTDPLNARGIGGVMQNINKVQGVVKKAEKEKANGYQPRFDGVTKRNTEAKIPTLADMKPMPTFEPTPHFETEKSVDADGKIVSKAKPKQIFDGSGQPKYVYQDSFTGKTYDPNDSDPHMQEMIKRGEDAASYVQEAPMQKVTDNDLVGLASSIDKRMHEIALQRNAEAATSDWSGLDMPRGGGALVGNWYTSTQNGVLADEGYKTLGIAQGALARAHKMVEEAEKSKREGNFSGFIKGAGRGFVDGVFEPETWDFGVSSLAEAGYIKSALDKFDSGQRLSKDEKILLDAKAMEMAVNAFYGSDLGRGYKAGKVTVEAIPFMIEMAINPASGAGKSAASMLTRYALKRFGKNGLVKASKKAAEKAFVRAEERALARGLSESAAKAAGKRAAARATKQTLKFKAAKTGARLLGDVAGASAMAATTGAVRTAADAVSRHSGDVKFDVDDKGHIVFAGHDKGDDWGTAVKKAFANTAIENYSELFGAYFSPIGSFVGKAGEKLLSKLGLGKVTEMLGKLSSSDIAKAVKRIEEKGQFNGVIGEDLEEQVGGIMNALIVGDQTLDTADGTGVFNMDNQIDTFLGVGLMGGIFSAARLGGGLVGGQGNLEARRAVRQAGIAAMKDFKGKELIWDQIKTDVDNASNDQLEQVVKNIVTDGGLSDENKKAALQYVRSSMYLRGVDAIRPLTKEEAEADAHNVQEEAAHNRGFDADAQERKDIAIESADPNNAEAQQAWAGVEQRIDDEATQMADALREKAQQIQHNDGSFHTATLKEKDEHGEGKQVFIVSGHVKMTPDGTMIDRGASDKTIVIFDPSTGERKMIDPSSDFGLSSVDEPTTSEELEASIERNRQGFIQNQLDEARGTIRLSVGQQFVLPDGNEAVVVALDESGEDITAMLADGTQVNIQRAELQQAHDDQALAEYRQRKGIEEPTAEDEEPEQSEQGVQIVQVEGAPSSYEPDMELVVRNESGGESQAIVMGRVRYEGGEFIPDENGGIVEYFMDGEVRHEQISKLNDRVVAYTDAAQVVEEETPPAEDVQAEGEAPLQEDESVPEENDTTRLDEEEPAPAAEEDAEKDNAMPMRDNGEEDWQATTPEHAHSYIFNEAGLSQREGNEFVAAQKEAAQRALNKAKSAQAPRVGTSIRQYNEAKAKHQEKIENAQRVLDYWNAVQDIQVAIQHKEREQKEAEDAKAHEEAAAQMQAEFEARKAESLQEDGDSGTSIVGVQDGAEQILALKEDEDPQGNVASSKEESPTDFTPSPRKEGEDLLDYAARVDEESKADHKRKQEEAKVNTLPSDAQKEAGNYKKGHIKVDGMDITIEQPKGSIRTGKDASGKEWRSEMHNTYGYIRGTESVDGDHIDIFLSDNPADGNVFVVDQVNKDGSFDEHKVMYGFADVESAKQAYLSNYKKGWQGLGNITEVSKDEFKKWIDSSKRKTKPFAEYTSVKTQDDMQTKKPTEAEDFTRQYLKELEDFQKNTDTTGRTAIDIDRYDAEDLFAPLILDGKPSNLGVLTVVSDKITDPASQIAVYDYSDEIDDKTNSGWQKWGDLADEYNKTVDKDDKAQERGDTATLGFRTVDAAVKFNDWLNTSTQTERTEEAQTDVAAPAMTEEEYLASKGLGSPMSDHMLDKTRIPHGETARQKARREREAEKAMKEHAARKKDARKEYQEKLANGELREPTKEETEKKRIDALIRTANGHEDNPSVLAARRVLDKRGIDWQKKDGQINTQTEENNAHNSEGIMREQKNVQLQQTTTTITNDTEAKQEASESEDIRFRQEERSARKLAEVNERFNRELAELTEKNAQSKRLKLGKPSLMLSAAGVPDKPIILYGNKLLKKAKLHNFDVKELHNLPLAMQNPIAVFEGSHPNSFATLLEIKLGGHNTLASIEVNKKGEADFNIISSLFGKESKGVTKWILDGKLLSVDKEKAQSYISASALNADATYKNELSSAANILKDFENPTIEGKNHTALSENTLPAEASHDREAMRNEAEQLAEKLHTPVNVVEDANKITHPNKEIEARRRKAKGWYNTTTGEVVVVLANHKDAADVAATISHEVIAHKGLRELVGEAHYDEFLDEVYNHLRGDLKREIDDAAGRAFLDNVNKSGDDVRDYKRHKRIAVDELFGSLAEKPFEEFSENERNLWQKIKEFAKKLLDRFLDKLKLPKWFELGDNELRYILWRSKERLERGKEDPIDQARDIVKREELGLANESLNKVSVTARNFDELAERNEWNPKPIRGEEMVDLYDIAPKVTTHDYYLGTKADFKLVKSTEDVWDAWEKLKQQDGFRHVHSPKSDSEYLVNDKTGEIYRISDHWGWVASCRWEINGRAHSGFDIGKANIKEFERIKGSYVFTPEAQRSEPHHKTYLRAKENLERALKDDTYKFTAAARRIAEEKVRSLQSNAEFYKQIHERGDIVYRRNEFGKYIPYREMKHRREQWFEGYISDEEREIVERAQADGSYMKAPNGKPSNLNGKQWAQVRTKAFKKWFGDWEKAARIEKLRKSEPVVISGNEYKGKYELNRDSAKAWIKENLRGEYTVADTGERIFIGRKGVNKVTSHSMGNESHLKCLVAIPQMLEQSVFITEEKAEKPNAQYPTYRYYVAGLKIGGVDYTAKLTIGVDENGNKYYDHALTEIEKGKLLDQINDQAVDNGFMSTGAEPNPSVTIGKDTKLVSILQVNSSKVVDENGEPQVIRSADDKHIDYFLNIRHPLEASEDVVIQEIVDKAVKDGYDGVHTPKGYIPFTVNQYKSAQRNNGEFSTESDDVLYRDSSETRDIWLDQSMGLHERTTAAAARLANNHRDNKVFMQDAMRAIGANLTDLRKAMRLQKDFDRTTAKRVYDLARILMEMGYLRGLNQQEVSKLLSVMKNSIGKQNIDSDVQKLMDLMVNHQLKQSKNTLESLERIKGSKVNAKGVEVQGVLDAEGQAIMAAMKAAKDIVTPCAGKTEEDNGELTAWGQALEDVQERIGSEDNAIAENAALEYQGMMLAQQWFDEIKQSELEEATLRKELNHAPSTTPAEDRKGEAYKEYIGNLKQAIQQNRIDRAQAYMNLVGQLTESLRESIEGAKAFKLREKARISAIQRDANLDMDGRPAGEHYLPDWKANFVNNSFVQFGFSPLLTYDQMFRMFGNKSANGEGFLYNRFVRDGWTDARQKEAVGVREKFKALDDKAAEIFGGEIKTWGDLKRFVSKLPAHEVAFKNGGEVQTFELTQGHMLYIYMANKMLDGRMKLAKMGISSEDVERLSKEIDPRLIKLADWLQEEFLVQTRNEYNETHKRIFGASMAAIENYFPLKIRSNARTDKAEDLDNPGKNSGISTTTGSIIKRRRNSLALDLLNADALDIILDHVQEMEHWNAFVEFDRDLNTLRTYKHFRNQVENITSVYGSGKMLWKNFNTVCQIAAGKYVPPRSKLDTDAVNLAKGVTAAKVSFRLFTALKQFLSFPAYFPEVRAVHIAKCLAHPKESWDWCMENLPIFNERWNSRLSGDPRLLKTNMDWKMWRTRTAEIAMRIGMTPNAFVDALTVCIGARAMYLTRKGQYLRDGYTEEIADKKAKQDAEILYNQTQQSSEGAFLSPMQVDRGWFSVLFSIFRNSSMAYTRQLYDATRNLRRNLTLGGRKESIAFMTKQYMNDGFDKAKAEENAKRKFDRQIRKDILRVATFGYILQFAWNLGAYLPYLLFGNDDDEKEVFWQDVFAHSYFGSLEGLTGGDVLSQGFGMLLTGNFNPDLLKKDMPLTSDFGRVLTEAFQGQHAEAISDMINLIVQSGIGVNPQSITDAVIGIIDACGDDPALANEATIFVARVLQVPQSQIEKLYFDEVGLMGSELSKYTPTQLAERYARYKVKRGRFYAPWEWDDKDAIRKKMKDPNKKIKERIGHMSDKQTDETISRYEEVYNSVDKKMKAYRDALKDDYAEAAEIMTEIQKDPKSLSIYQRYTSMDRQLDKLAKMYLKAKSAKEMIAYKKMMITYRDAMAKSLEAKGEAAQEKAMADMEDLLEGFAEEQAEMYGFQ